MRKPSIYAGLRVFWASSPPAYRIAIAGGQEAVSRSDRPKRGAYLLWYKGVRTARLCTTADSPCPIKNPSLYVNGVLWRNRANGEFSLGTIELTEMRKYRCDTVDFLNGNFFCQCVCGNRGLILD